MPKSRRTPGFVVALPLLAALAVAGEPSAGEPVRRAAGDFNMRDFRFASGETLPELRLVLGTSMGGMHIWLWGETYPDFADALMPLASLPGPIAGRNRMWRMLSIDMIRNDPAWRE